jgi:L-aspartate oxidase
MTRAALQEIMWSKVGLVRDEAGLAEAAQTVDVWCASLGSDESSDAGRREEDVNMTFLASVIIRAARARTESRGAHARTDYPGTDPNQARSVRWLLEGVIQAEPIPATRWRLR